ncbi:hypothetical protein XU18_3118 [Perkinsela sp. CCAP 1560/4]|nr:hypothetical protein XU18_3118 [Perkinsela sp. CCAP 1560/4]|eukprot:KNH05956.1 hypothetical protein XU18_3118 [Perkinsela sp. CCAP 1560/4]
MGTLYLHQNKFSGTIDAGHLPPNLRFSNANENELSEIVAGPRTATMDQWWLGRTSTPIHFHRNTPPYWVDPSTGPRCQVEATVKHIYHHVVNILGDLPA